MNRQNEINRSVQEIETFFSNNEGRVPEIIAEIKRLQGALHLPMIDYEHEMYLGPLSKNLADQETNIFMSLDGRTNEEIAMYHFHNLMRCDYVNRRKLEISLQEWIDKPQSELRTYMIDSISNELKN